MNDPEGISTFLCTYNHAPYVRKALESIFKQSIKPKQVMVLNDGSTDETFKTFWQLEKDFPIEVIQHPNRIGHIQSYNECLKACREPFIHLMAADDELASEHFYEDALILMTPSVGFVAGGLGHIDEKGKSLGTFVEPPKLGIVAPKIVLTDLQYTGNFICGGCVLVRREAYEPYDEDFPFSADFLQWVRILSKGWKAGFIGGIQYLYRRHANQMTHLKTAPVQEIRLIFEEIRAALSGEVSLSHES